MEASILPPVDGLSRLAKSPLSAENTRRSRVLTCKRCKFSTVDSKQFLSHQFKAHDTIREEVKRRCDKCPFETTKYTELLAHKRSKHRRSLGPSSRKSSMEGDSGLLEETNNNNNNTNPIKVSSLHQDVISAGTFTSRATPTSQHGGADGIMVYECSICPYATAKAANYSKHLDTHKTGGRRISYGEASETLTHQGEEGYGRYEEANETFNAWDRDYEIKQMQKSYGSELLKQGNGSYRIPDPDDDEQVLVIDENPMKSFAPATSAIQRPVPTQVPVMGVPVRAKPGPKPNSGVSKPRTGCAPVREAVDPAKYITIQEPDGIKYACSKCGNIYKWRKSLNKHWKEKHDGEIPDPRPNLTALNIPRLGKGYVTGLPNGKGNVISFMRPQQQMESPPKSNQPVYMPPGEMSSAIRTALKRPAMSEAAVQETMRKNSSMVKSSPSPQRIQAPKMARMSHPEAFPRYSSTPSSKDKIMQSMAKYSPSSMAKGRTPYRDSSAMDLTGLTPQQMPATGPSRFPAQLAQPDILDLSKKAPEITIRQISPVKATTEVSLQDEPMDLSVKPKCEVIVSSIKHETERVEGFGYDNDEMSSLGRQCPSCAYVASNKLDYDQHMELHLRKQLHKCAECQAVFGSMERLNEHFIGSHTETIQQNLMGNFSETPRHMPKTASSAESTQLYKYLTMDSQHQQLSCMVCGVICQWPWTLAKHFQQEHHMLPNPYQKKGQSHATSATTGSQPSSPPFSDDEYPSHDGQLIDDLESLQCTQCSFVADSPRELSKHQMQHGSGNQYFCQVCSFATKWRDQMVKHYKQEHPTAASDLNQLVAHSVQQPDSGEYMSPSGRQLVDLSDEDTAIVFPQAPEDEVPSGGRRPECKPGKHNMQRDMSPGSSTEMNLPFKCTVCEYRARWPSEITQHTKNHSDEKPFLCPRCSYRSKWKWDVVKHLKRCGGGTVNDVIDTTKQRKAHNVQAIVSDAAGSNKGLQGMSLVSQRELLSNGPPNVTVMPQDSLADRSMDLSASRDLSDSLNMSHGSDDGLSNGDERNILGNYLDASGNTNTDPNSQAYHVCLHCPFVGNSPAELKRHSRVHSDEKPFICKTCGYCSKWKCDLKKHLRTYNHTSAVPLTYGGHGRKPADWKDKSEDGTSDGDSTDEKMTIDGYTPSSSKAEGPLLYKCDKAGCQYVTYKKNFMDSHMKIHRTTITPKQAGKLKCKQCDFGASDLPTFLQHKLTHSTQQPGDAISKLVSPEASSSQNSPTDFVTKHRRKASHQNRIVSSRSSNDEDDGDTESLEGRRSLPIGTVTPIVHDLSSSQPGPVKATPYTCVHCPYRTENRNNFEKHIKFHNIQNKYVCEWCSWSIDRLNLLYRHAQTVHPTELALQEKETFYGKVRGRRSQSHDSAEDLDYKDDMLLSPAELANESSIRKMSWAKRQDMSNIEKRRVEARREISGIDEEIPPELRSKRRRRLKTCQKCGYITDNVTTLQRHMAKHGSRGKFTCDYCDYSVDRQHIVEYHIKIVHQTSDPLQSQNEEPSEFEKQLAEMEDASMADEEHSDQDAMDSHFDGDETNGEGTVNGDGNITSEIIKVKGRELKVDREGNKANYNCLKCPFVTGNITNACNHVKQHGAKKKYTCELCDYSLDQLRHVMQHMRKVHGHGGDCSLSDNGEDLTLDEHVDDTATDAVYDEDTLDYVNKPHSKPMRMTFGGVPPKSGPVTSTPHKSRMDYKRYHCMRCPYVAQDLAGLKRHQGWHSRLGGRFPCSECSYKATTAKLLTIHAKIHS